MATIAVSISAPVGVRHGVSTMPNTPQDLATVMDLFDRISIDNGGTAGQVPWAADHDLLVAEVTALIVAFQTRHARPIIDGVIDPNGGTLRQMNELAADPAPPVTADAWVVPAPGGRSEAIDDALWVAEPASVPGREPLRKQLVPTRYSRRLVRCDRSSVPWFGVVVPPMVVVGKVPHVFFTPTPAQGGYYDHTYEEFSAWGQLWDDYTSRIGGQMAAATSDQILIIPLYRNAQAGDLGSMRSDWQRILSQVATAAIMSVDPLLLRREYTFDRLVSSSFSNGWIAHKSFHDAPGVADMTAAAFDLDGSAASPTSLYWRPRNGVKYIDAPVVPGQYNPSGRDFRVGQRWGEIAEIYQPGDRSKTHFMCSAHLLFHGVTTFPA